MAVPSSGELELYGDIGTELGVAQSNVTLHGMSQTAGFTEPDAMSEFYGYSPSTASFNTVLYTGDGTSNRTISGFGFDPDFIWLKPRNVAYSHNLFDVIRGDGIRLVTNTTSGDQDIQYSKFTTDGFIEDASRSNENGVTYVAWGWKAGGAAVLDTSGDLDAYVSANPAAGFSIIKPNVQTNVNQTIPHGLTQAPDLIILKTTDVSQNWFVSAPTTSGLTPDTRKYGVLNTSDAFTTGGTGAGTGYAPTVNSTFIITPGVAGVTNYDYWFGKTNIIYAFHSVAGFSKFGSYTGGSTGSGNVINTGFKPMFVMVKRTDIAGDAWQMFDSVRGGGDTFDNYVQANTPAAEVSYNQREINLTANGFYWTFAESGSNISGGTYIYMAFANQF